MFPYRCMRSLDRFTGSTDVKGGWLVRGQCHFKDLLPNPLIVCTTLPRTLTSGFAHIVRLSQVGKPFCGWSDDAQGVRNRAERHSFAHPQVVPVELARHGWIGAGHPHTV